MGTSGNQRIASHTYFIRPTNKFYDMPTPPTRNASSTCLAILSLVSIAMFSGCDLGTYNKRLNELPGTQNAPQEPDSESTNEASETE